jgi:hypothetical protein
MYYIMYYNLNRNICRLKAIFKNRFDALNGIWEFFTQLVISIYSCLNVALFFFIERTNNK